MGHPVVYSPANNDTPHPDSYTNSDGRWQDYWKAKPDKVHEKKPFYVDDKTIKREQRQRARKGR